MGPAWHCWHARVIVVCLLLFSTQHTFYVWNVYLSISVHRWFWFPYSSWAGLKTENICLSFHSVSYMLGLFRIQCWYYSIIYIIRYLYQYKLAPYYYRGLPIQYFWKILSPFFYCSSCMDCMVADVMTEIDETGRQVITIADTGKKSAAPVYIKF